MNNSKGKSQETKVIQMFYLRMIGGTYKLGGNCNNLVPIEPPLESTTGQECASLLFEQA